MSLLSASKYGMYRKAALLTLPVCPTADQANMLHCNAVIIFTETYCIVNSGLNRLYLSIETTLGQTLDHLSYTICTLLLGPPVYKEHDHIAIERSYRHSTALRIHRPYTRVPVAVYVRMYCVFSLLPFSTSFWNSCPTET